MKQTKEQEIESLRKELKRHRTFKLTEPVEPDIPPPTEQLARTEGWTYNPNSMEVRQAWSESEFHGYDKPQGFSNPSYCGPISLYSTRVRALRALRYEIELQTIEKLQTIDDAIQTWSDFHGGNNG